MHNKSKIIDGHNKKVTSERLGQTPECNCWKQQQQQQEQRQQTESPMEGNCQVNDEVY